MIRGGVATVYVSDMDRSVAFYTSTLGLALRERYGNEWASVDVGDGLVIGLHPASPHAPKPGTHGAISIGLTVSKPIGDVVRLLTGRGVRFRGRIRDDGGIKLAFFGDPDGNDLYLCELAEDV